MDPNNINLFEGMQQKCANALNSDGTTNKDYTADTL